MNNTPLLTKELAKLNITDWSMSTSMSVEAQAKYYEFLASTDGLSPEERIHAWQGVTKLEWIITYFTQTAAQLEGPAAFVKPRIRDLFDYYTLTEEICTEDDLDMLWKMTGEPYHFTKMRVSGAVVRVVQRYWDKEQSVIDLFNHLPVSFVEKLYNQVVLGSGMISQWFKLSPEVSKFAVQEIFYLYIKGMFTGAYQNQYREEYNCKRTDLTRHPGLRKLVETVQVFDGDELPYGWLREIART